MGNSEFGIRNVEELSDAIKLLVSAASRVRCGRRADAALAVRILEDRIKWLEYERRIARAAERKPDALAS